MTEDELSRRQDLKMSLADLQEALQPFLGAMDRMQRFTPRTAEEYAAGSQLVQAASESLVAAGDMLKRHADAWHRFAVDLAALAEKLGGTEAPPS